MDNSDTPEDLQRSKRDIYLLKHITNYCPLEIMDKNSSYNISKLKSPHVLVVY